QADIMLAWEKGHSELQREIFRWFYLRQAPNRSLVRLCASWPPLQGPTIRLLDLAGRAAHKLGMRKASRACYSAIYNLAYWLAIMETIGRRQFWARVRQAKGSLRSQGLGAGGWGLVATPQPPPIAHTPTFDALRSEPPVDNPSSLADPAAYASRERRS